MEFTIKVKIKAADIMQAGLIQAGIQNILNELEPSQFDFIADLSNPDIAKSYKSKLLSIINNPLVKTLANKFGG